MSANRLKRRASNNLTRRRIENFNPLTAEVYSSLVDYLDELGALRVPPFDAGVCDSATVQQKSRKRIDWFIETAKRDIEDLVQKGLLVPKGAGRGLHYQLTKKRLINGSNGSG